MGLPSAYTVNNGLEGSGPTVNTVTSTLFPNTPIVFGAITDQVGVVLQLDVQCEIRWKIR